MGSEIPGPRRSRGLCLGRCPDWLHCVHRGMGKARQEDWKRYWCGENRVTHFIGGDIIYHHTIFWPALLKGAGYGVPHAVVASGMVKVDDHKFSKSRGYVVWTNDDYLDKGLPADYLRYYLLAYTSHTKELNFSWKVFGERINNEVVNIFGNFVYRTLYFAQKEFEGIPPARSTLRSWPRSKRALQRSTSSCGTMSSRVRLMRS